MINMEMYQEHVGETNEDPKTDLYNCNEVALLPEGVAAKIFKIL